MLSSSLINMSTTEVSSIIPQKKSNAQINNWFITLIYQSTQALAGTAEVVKKLLFELFFRVHVCTLCADFKIVNKQELMVFFQS